MFYEKFFNKTTKDNMVAEFMNLKMEDITLAYYKVWFNQLSRFTKNMVTRDTYKPTKFLMGLEDDIRVQHMYQGIQTYTIIISIAYRVEQVNLERSFKIETSSITKVGHPRLILW